MMSNSSIETRVNSREIKSRKTNNREVQSKYQNNNRRLIDRNHMEIKFSRIIKVSFIKNQFSDKLNYYKSFFRSIKLLQINFQINKVITNLFLDQ